MFRSSLILLKLLIAFLVIFPFIWMIFTALRPEGHVLTLSLKGPYTLENFYKVVIKYNFWRYSLNSFLVAFTSAFVSTFFVLLASYPFAFYRFKGKTFLFYLALSTMMIPGLLFVIPQFLIVYKLGWLNTYQGMIVPHLANVFGLFLIVQYLKNFPPSLLESARIDGASEFEIIFKIVLPLSLPIVLTVFLLNFQFHWANFLWQLIIAQDDSMYTIPVALNMFKSQYEELYHLRMAASSLSILPIAIIFIFAQRYFIQGITGGAIKG